MAKSKAPRAIWVPPPKNILQLKISLRYIKPPIWRRVLVPDNLLLGQLHSVIQASMGWDNCHLHAFRSGGGFGPTEYASAATAQDLGPAAPHEDAVFLGQLVGRKGQAFSYEYDFGDSWQHEVKVEKIMPFDPGLKAPVCLEGERACPPEDCGGVPGYFDVLQALERPRTKGAKAMLQWLGDFDPAELDLNGINRRLQSVTKPMAR